MWQYYYYWSFFLNLFLAFLSHQYISSICDCTFSGTARINGELIYGPNYLLSFILRDFQELYANMEIIFDSRDFFSKYRV